MLCEVGWLKKQSTNTYTHILVTLRDSCATGETNNIISQGLLIYHLHLGVYKKTKKQLVAGNFTVHVFTERTCHK